jgi:hypothetical protein
MNELQLELAQLAARHIAEEGLNYGQAKRKAAKQSGIAESSAVMPDNPTIEAALREYQAQFQADTQPQELQRLRKLALQWMTELANLQGLNAPCQVLAVGAVVNGTANEHSAVHLQVFTDEDKYLEMGLLNAGIQTTPSEQKVDGKMRPILVANDAGTPVVLTLFPLVSYAPPKIGSIGEYAQLANAAQLTQIMECS